jgi:hypothetical protein
VGTDERGVTVSFDERLTAVDALLMFAAGVLAHRPADGTAMQLPDLQALAARAGVVNKTRIAEPCGAECRCVDLPFPVNCYQPVPGISAVAGEALAKLLARPA